jgi:hypothetical protein
MNPLPSRPWPPPDLARPRRHAGQDDPKRSLGWSPAAWGSSRTIRHATGSFLVVCSILLAACSGSLAKSHVGPRDTAESAANEYFPLTPGRAWLYAGIDGEVVVTEAVVVDDVTRMIDGVACRALVKETRRDGKPDHLSNEWFAVDVDGNVWKFGEESYGWDGTAYAIAGSAWFAGEGDAFAWLFLPAQPVPGDSLIGHGPEHEERTDILAIDARVAVPAGAFARCVSVLEIEDDEPDDADLVLYAPGVGRVMESNPSGKIELVGPLGGR